MVEGHNSIILQLLRCTFMNAVYFAHHRDLDWDLTPFQVRHLCGEGSLKLKGSIFAGSVIFHGSKWV
jgi:hypothetical protein